MNATACQSSHDMLNRRNRDTLRINKFGAKRRLLNDVPPRRQHLITNHQIGTLKPNPIPCRCRFQGHPHWLPRMQANASKAYLGFDRILQTMPQTKQTVFLLPVSPKVCAPYTQFKDCNGLKHQGYISAIRRRTVSTSLFCNEKGLPDWTAL